MGCFESCLLANSKTVPWILTLPRFYWENKGNILHTGPHLLYVIKVPIVVSKPKQVLWTKKGFLPYPGSHCVSLRWPEMDIENYYCYTNTENILKYAQIFHILKFRLSAFIYHISILSQFLVCQNCNIIVFPHLKFPPQHKLNCSTTI